MKKIGVAMAVASCLLVAGCGATGVRLTAASLQDASQTAPDPCSVPVAYLASSGPSGTNTQAFYKASCSSPAVQLTSDPAYVAFSVAMMPGSRNVVVALADAATESSEGVLVEINVQTLSQTKIADSPGTKAGLSVSPTGDAVSYSFSGTATAPQGVYVQRLDGSAPVLVSPPGVIAYAGATSWSHDGLDIAYTDAGGNRIVYVPSDGSQVVTTVVSSQAVSFGPPAWTPDDKGLLFTDKASTTQTINYVDRATGAITTIASEPDVPIPAFIAVDQHWSALEDGLASFWLGNPGTTTTNYTGASGGYAPSVDTSGPADPAPPGWPPTSPTPSPSPSPSPTASFVVQIDDRNVGKVFGSVTGRKVLGSKILPPSQACRSGWEVATTNNTAFVLHTPTNGNVTGTRVDVGQSDSSYLVPGQTAYYCVAFTQLNQIFDVLYDMSDALARGADVVMLLTDLIGFQSANSTALANLISSIASMPALQRIGACIGKANALCAPQAINALMANGQSRNLLLHALFDYAQDLGKSVSLTWLESHLRQNLVKVITTAWWVAEFTGQVALSSAGYVAFETSGSSQ